MQWKAFGGYKFSGLTRLRRQPFDSTMGRLAGAALDAFPSAFDPSIHKVVVGKGQVADDHRGPKAEKVRAKGG